jgi:predicted Zn finger-like uncharacterized protein
MPRVTYRCENCKGKYHVSYSDIEIGKEVSCPTCEAPANRLNLQKQMAKKELRRGLEKTI